MAGVTPTGAPPPAVDAWRAGDVGTRDRPPPGRPMDAAELEYMAERQQRQFELQALAWLGLPARPKSEQ